MRTIPTRAGGRGFHPPPAEAFYGVVRQLEERGIPRPRLHVLSSYGLLNGIQAPGQLVRVGIALYGMLSTQRVPQRCPVP